MYPEKTNINRRDFLRLAGIAAASSALAAACSPVPASGPAQTRVPATNSPATPTLIPAASAPLSVIALNRMGFGPRPGDIDSFNALGASDEERLRAYIQQQLNPNAIDDGDFEKRFSAAEFKTLNKTLEELFADHIVNNPYKQTDDRYWQWYSMPVDELVKATHLRATYSRKQLNEVLADFWHNHFNVYGWVDGGAPLFASYDRDVIRGHMLGNFRQFLEAVASHPVMLYYLNNNTNSNAGPNENFARELFELHTLGAENYLGVHDPNQIQKNANGIAIGYVDNDVYEAARCFTGWRVEDDYQGYEDGVGKSGRFLFYKSWHDRFNKIVLGHYISADQPDMQDAHNVLDLLATHPGTARFIARKLCRRLISDNPPDSVVEAAAKTFSESKDAPDQLKRVVETILLSNEFRTTWGEKIRRPFEATIATMRALNAEFTIMPNNVNWVSNLMGQPIFEHHAPNGYPDTKEAWANSMSILYRWNLAVGLTENWLNEDKGGPTIVVDVKAQTPPDLKTAEALTDFWINRLLGHPLPDAARQVIVNFAAGDSKSSDALADDVIADIIPGLVQLILMCPEFQLR